MYNLQRKLVQLPRLFVVCCLLFVLSASAGNAGTPSGIDSTFQHAWGENIGWTVWGTTQGNVVVSDTELTGYVWAENAGWLSLNCSNTGTCGTVNYKVSNTTFGILSGYAWGENIGWVSFNCTNTGSCATGQYGVSIGGTGEFAGHAWGENVGWIVFNCATTLTCGSVNYKVKTAGWVAQVGAGNPPPPPPTGTPTPTVSPTATPTASPTASPIPTLPGTPTPVPTPVPTSFPTATPGPTPPPPGTPLPPPPGATPPAPPPAGPPPPPIFPPGGGIGGIIDTIKSIIENLVDLFNRIPLKEETSQGISVVGTLVTIVSTGTSLLGVLGSIGELPSLIQHVVITLFQLLGLKRRRQEWGTVYNSLTKEPIPLAKVSLYLVGGRLIESRITDLQGRYGFLIAQELRGSDFVIKAEKTNFAFPSQRVTTPTDTILYQHVYRGELINIQAGAVTNFDIPLDSLVPQALSVRKRFGLKFSNTLIKIMDIVFWIAVFTLPISVYLNPTPLNIIVLAVFALFTLIRIAGFKQRPYGVVTDAQGNPVPYSLIVLNDIFGRRKAFSVSDPYGRYFILTDKGDYVMVKSTPAQIIPGRISEEQVTTPSGWIKKKVTI